MSYELSFFSMQTNLLTLSSRSAALICWFSWLSKNDYASHFPHACLMPFLTEHMSWFMHSVIPLLLSGFAWPRSGTWIGAVWNARFSCIWFIASRPRVATEQGHLATRQGLIYDKSKDFEGRKWICERGPWQTLYTMSFSPTAEFTMLFLSVNNLDWVSLI